MSVTLSHRPLPVEGTHNLREVAGYSAGASVVRPGRLYRSDALHALSSEGRGMLADLDVRRVLDLRSEVEATAWPSRLPETAEIVHVPVFTGAGQPVDVFDATVTLARIYDVIIDRHGDRLAAAVTAIARSDEGAILVHCTAGKDRTGLVIALALLAAGVSREDVVMDYALTETNLAGEWAAQMLARMRDEGGALSPRLVEILTASPADLMSDVIDRWDREWGSASEYLRVHGVTQGDLDALTAMLLHPLPAAE